jgi:hypothetical protein
MERLKPFEDLAEAARQETVDGFDISGRVIKCLLSFSQTDRWDIFLFFGLLSAATAAVSFWFGTNAWNCLTNPILTIYIPIQSVLW